MPTCLGLSLLGEKTLLPGRNKPPFLSQPLPSRPHGYPLLPFHPRLLLSIIRSGAGERSPYELGQQIQLWQIKEWGVGNKVENGGSSWGRRRGAMEF